MKSMLNKVKSKNHIEKHHEELDVTEKIDNISTTPVIKTKLPLNSKYNSKKDYSLQCGCLLEDSKADDFRSCGMLCKFLPPQEQREIILNNSNMLNPNVTQIMI